MLQCTKSILRARLSFVSRFESFAIAKVFARSCNTTHACMHQQQVTLLRHRSRFLRTFGEVAAENCKQPALCSPSVVNTSF